MNTPSEVEAIWIFSCLVAAAAFGFVVMGILDIVKWFRQRRIRS